MKKSLLAAIAVLGTIAAHAQEVKFGVKGGAGVSTFSGNVADIEGKFAAHLGGFSEFTFHRFAVQPEILISYIGAERNYRNHDLFVESPIDNLTITADLLYLHVPVMAKYYIISPLSVEVGPQLGILLDARSEYEAQFTNGEQVNESENIKNELKTIDFGLNFGATYNFKNKMFVGARYTLGLTNIDDSVPEPGEKPLEVKNQVFQVSVGYKF